MDPQNSTGAPPSYVPAQTAPESRRAVAAPPARGRGGIAILLFFLFIGCPMIFLVGLAFGLVGCGGSASVPIQEQHHSLEKGSEKRIAIISVEGTILEGDGFVKQQIDRVREDDSIKAVVLRIDSPGGTVTGSDYIHHHLVKLFEERKIPAVVSMGGMAASGGYYIAMSVGDKPDTIFAEPTTWTGSIGVIIPHYNFAGLMERFDVQEDSVKSHPLKQIGSPTRIMTEQERAILQALVDDSFARFKGIVQSGRPWFRDHEDELTTVATGQVFTTNQAIANKLVDREGFIEEAIDRAIELAALDKTDVEVIEYQAPLTLASLLPFAKAQSAPAGLEFSTLMELTAPKAWYLCSWLPDLRQE